MYPGVALTAHWGVAAGCNASQEIGNNTQESLVILFTGRAPRGSQMYCQVWIWWVWQMSPKQLGGFSILH
ncbi:hypothetical protein KC19_VG245200 [Ceratodon purpureus]|uniref:Uncharacterized protein n=1 Tax=Ceratodon purpureus TaxID=3225 RepID=A0A8T0HUL6_CERPU|nr:hypothetical protein KC19_VG245200 [Ceratodon purpureus]